MLLQVALESGTLKLYLQLCLELAGRPWGSFTSLGLSLPSCQMR